MQEIEYEQIDLFENIYPKFKIDKKVRLIELFAGIGSQAKALKRLGVDFEHYKVVEFDKHAINSYNAIHNTNFKTQDIKTLKGDDLEIKERERFIYIMTYSFPCQDLSLAGKQKGMKKGEGTRSGLLWEVERLLDEINPELPQVLLMENVPQVIGIKNIKDFQLWRRKLESLGYECYVQLLNAKNYGIPQNRNRCFMVSLLGKYFYNFPKKQKLKLKLKDMLEEKVDEKYYLSKKALNRIANTTFHQSSLDARTEKRGCIPTLAVRDYKDPKLVVETLKKKLANKLIDDNLINEGDMIYHSYTNNRLNNIRPINTTQNKDNNISASLTTRADTLGICVNEIVLPEATKKGFTKAKGGDGVYINRPHQKRGVVQKEMIQTIKTNCDDIGVVIDNEDDLEACDFRYDVGLRGRVEKKLVPTITTRAGGGISGQPMIKNNLRIRKLTPKECWRLMGFDDEDYNKARQVNSESQLYKQAGNSIVVNVLEAIFKELI